MAIFSIRSSLSHSLLHANGHARSFCSLPSLRRSCLLYLSLASASVPLRHDTTSDRCGPPLPTLVSLRSRPPPRHPPPPDRNHRARTDTLAFLHLDYPLLRRPRRVTHGCSSFVNILSQIANGITLFCRNDDDANNSAAS